MQTIFDPLRKKEVALTPEERVRQWMIGVLSQELEVPLHMMMSEAGFIYDRKAAPLAVVECKRPEVELTPEVLDQVIRYNMVLSVPYMFITNGTRTLICRRRELDGRYGFIDKAPTYSEMLCQQ